MKHTIIKSVPVCGIETLTKLFVLDMMSAFVIHGATLTDYFEYEFSGKVMLNERPS